MGQGFGLNSSGFRSQAATSAENLFSGAAVQDISLAEAAKNRKVGMLGLANQLQAGRAAFPGNFMNAFSQMQTQGPQNQLNVLQSLLGQAQPGGIMQQGANPTDNLAGTFGALADTLPGFVDSLAGLRQTPNVNSLPGPATTPRLPNSNFG